MLSLVLLIITYAAQWKYFQKMGREGWEGIIPFYNLYVLFEELYGNGWQCLFLLIPFVNIYIAIKLQIDLAKAFNKGVGFGLGLVFLNFIFSLLLAFGDAVYRDGSHNRVDSDIISENLEKVHQTFSGKKPGTSEDPIDVDYTVVDEEPAAKASGTGGTWSGDSTSGTWTPSTANDIAAEASEPAAEEPAAPADPEPAAPASEDSIADRLNNLKELLKDGMITESEFRTMKEQLLKRF